MSDKGVRMTPESGDVQVPHSRWDLFLSFSWLAIQGSGGVMAIAQRELVERKRWLTSEKFLADWAVAHVLPGPNIVNLSVMLGDRYFGWTGAAAAVAGLFCFPLMLVLLLALGYGSFGHSAWIQGALGGVAVVVSALITSTALKLIPLLGKHPLGRPLCLGIGALTLWLVAYLRWPLPWVLASVGTAAWAGTLFRLRRALPDEDRHNEH